MLALTTTSLACGISKYLPTTYYRPDRDEGVEACLLFFEIDRSAYSNPLRAVCPPSPVAALT